ncbi:hypothetical protein [Variovorax sp. dw_308]|uniref:hypothetical protein n=1 Tax=Variovorax sp. dw_308 TaxID=2721546 RepID=UPI001C447C8F|nr:hypothetical protein [Variovorax sp. dw_308]
MVNKALLARAAELEKWLGMHDDPLPTLFLVVVDASLPDGATLEDAGPVISGQVEYSDETTIGYTLGMSGAPLRGIRRRHAERLDDLKARAMETHPGCRVFMPVYAGELRSTDVEWNEDLRDSSSHPLSNP